MRQQNRQPYDQGPKERRQHNRVAVELDANHRARLRILDQTELDRLVLERLISLDQHTAGEHLYRDVHAAGYIPACRWQPDCSIRSSYDAISTRRANVLLRVGMARAWLLAKTGRRTTEFLFGVVLGERKVPEPQLPFIRRGLDSYQSFEGWWHDKDTSLPIPELLAELPRDVQRSRPFSYA